MKRIDRARPEPLYHQLEVLLRGRILSGEWPPGTRIPTERELCETYKVSRVTARQAMKNLVDGGFLSRKPGRGTFVRAPLLTAGERGLRSFSEDMRDLSLRPGSRLLSLSIEPADAGALERLDLATGSDVVKIKRLRTGDGHAIGVQLTRLPAARFGDLSTDELADGSLYDLLETRYGVHIVEAHEKFWVTKVSSEDAAVLSVAVGDPAFRVERVAYDENGPMEFTTSLMRGDRYQIQWVLKGRGDKPPPKEGD